MSSRHYEEFLSLRRDVHRLADRIAKLEAAQWGASGPWACSVCGANARRTPAGILCRDHEQPAAAGPIPPGYALAPGWIWCGRGGSYCKGVCQKWNGVYYKDGWGGACELHAVEMHAIVTDDSPTTAGFHVVCRSGPNVELKPGQRVCCRCGCGLTEGEPWSSVSQEAWDAGEYDILEPTEPPAPAQGAPAEPLSARMQRDLDRGVFSLGSSRAEEAFACRIDEVAALEARLAAAERSVDRHRLVLDEERRCYGILKAKLAAAETEKETLSTHCVRAERIAQERKEALTAAERGRDEALRDMGAVRRIDVDAAVAAERERCIRIVRDRWIAEADYTIDEVADAIRDVRPVPK